MKLPKGQQPILVHGAWALLTISTYVVGSQWGRHSKDGGELLSDTAARPAGEAPSNRDFPSALKFAGRPGIESASPGGRGWIGDELDIDPASGESLTLEAIESLVRSATRSAGPLERRRGFDRILQAVQSSDLTKEQAIALRKSMVEHRASGDQWRLFDYAWGARHPEAAIAYLDEIPKEHRDAFLGSMIPGLASENPQAAIDLFQSLEPDLQGKIRPRFLEGLVDNDVALATDYLYDSSDPESPDWRPMDTLARQIEKDSGLESTLSWAAELPEGSLRSNAWSAAYAMWGSQDPHAAVESIVAMPQSADRDQAINGFISAHAHEDGERATIWAAEIQSAGMREAAMVRAGRQYYSQDQEAAAQWFESSGLPQSAWTQVTNSKK